MIIPQKVVAGVRTNFRDWRVGSCANSDKFGSRATGVVVGVRTQGPWPEGSLASSDISAAVFKESNNVNNQQINASVYFEAGESPGELSGATVATDAALICLNM